MTSALELSHLERAAAEGTCPRCAREVAREGLACAQCGADVSVDVLLGAAVTDERTRYRLARALVTLLGTEFAVVSDALRAEQPVVVARVSRRSADAVLEVLAPFGLETMVAYAPVSHEVEAAVPERTSRVVATVEARVLRLVARLREAARSRGGMAVAGAFFAGAIVAGVAYAALAPSDAGEVRAVVAPLVPVSSRDRVRAAMASILLVRSERSLGTGFCVAANRVLTNAHVVRHTRPHAALRFHDGRETIGTVLTVDEGHDLALVRIDVPCPPLPIGDGGSIEAGDPILVLGHPRGLEFSVTRGIVSHPARMADGIVLIQTDAPINSGNSGGPMLDENGNVVGIVTLKDASGEGLAFAVPINYAYAGGRPFIARPYGIDTRTFDARDEAARDEVRASPMRAAVARGRPVLISTVGEGARIEAELAYFDPPVGDFVVRFFLASAEYGECDAVIRDTETRFVPSEDYATQIPMRLAGLVASRPQGTVRVEGHVLDVSYCDRSSNEWLFVQGGVEGFERARIE